MYRVVLDTNVVLAGLWSRTGAANQLFAELRMGHWKLLLSNHLILEYEEVTKRNSSEIGLTFTQIDDFLDAMCMAAEEHHLKPGWPPQLSDPDDEPILQLAVEASADAVVTRNLRHLQPVERFGIMLLTPPQFLARLRTAV